ncbi:MAG: hypothetical protein KF819_35730 [Labilithrix sp.]|nr:hypothetical protein [Labilithrix sp.]
MFLSAARLAAIAALCATSLACSAPTNDEPDEPREIEVALALSIDDVDVRHGAVRIAATMDEGSPDVSMWLGSACEEREVGHGIATHASFTWHLTREELGRAIACNLVVRVRARGDDGARVRKVATVDVGVSFTAEDPDESPDLREQTTGSETTRLAFRAPKRATRLHAAGEVIGAEPDDDDDAPPGFHDSAFEVPNDALARSVIARRPLVVLGSSFVTALKIGDVTFDGSEPVESSEE